MIDYGQRYGEQLTILEEQQLRVEFFLSEEFLLKWIAVSDCFLKKANQIVIKSIENVVYLLSFGNIYFVSLFLIKWLLNNDIMKTQTISESGSKRLLVIYRAEI